MYNSFSNNYIWPIVNMYQGAQRCDTESNNECQQTIREFPNL